MIIRPATPGDRGAVLLMVRHFLDHSLYGALFESDVDAGGLFDTVLAAGLVLVADNGDHLVGMLAIVALLHPLGGKLYAEEVCWWVEPEHRSGFIGPKMLRSAEDWARRKGCSVVKMVAPHGSTVGDFYGRIGYTPIETAYIKVL